jgi:hypothetical protein
LSGCVLEATGNANIGGSSHGRRAHQKTLGEAVESDAPPHSAQNAPFQGFNFHLNVLKALQATYETAKVAVKTLAAAHVTFDTVTWLGIGVEALAAVRTSTSKPRIRR